MLKGSSLEYHKLMFGADARKRLHRFCHTSESWQVKSMTVAVGVSLVQTVVEKARNAPNQYFAKQSWATDIYQQLYRVPSDDFISPLRFGAGKAQAGGGSWLSVAGPISHLITQRTCLSHRVGTTLALIHVDPRPAPGALWHCFRQKGGQRVSPLIVIGSDRLQGTVHNHHHSSRRQAR